MHIAEFERNGFGVFENILNAEIVALLKSELASISFSDGVGEKNGSVYGVRNLLNLVPAVRRFSESRTVRELAENFLGAGAKIVRAIYFDKTVEANWKVPWHQDLTIAVQEKCAAEGFAPWTRKAGIWHVQPPLAILEEMITLRFHLDDADETNGALKVIAGSHQKGRLSQPEIKKQREANEITVCSVKQGDCLIMRPLILHSSAAGPSPKHRRVIHLEFSGEDLPNGLEWYGS